MRTKTSWSIITLIVSVQLILLLISVMALFSWFLSHTEHSVGQQVCSYNQVVAQNIIQWIVQTENDSPEPNLEEFSSVFSETIMPNRGFICVVDSKSGKVIATSNQHPNLLDSNLGETLIEPIDKTDHQAISLRKDFASSEKNAICCGRASIADVACFVSAINCPQKGFFVLVGQDRSQAIGAVAKNIAWVRQIFFILTLVIGLVCICLTVSSLTRMSENVESTNSLLELEVSNREEEIVKTQSAVIFGLAKLAESRDNDTGEHLDRIRSYVMILSEDLERRMDAIDQDFVHNLALASSLHDIGKVGIPDSILLKPGRLSPEEREIMELHTLIGGECLEAIQNRLENNVFMHYAKQVAYYHHERWDGKGYPHGLSGTDIPLVARIVAVADVYDALTSKRPYKQPLSHLESKAIILSGSGSQFDPEVVDAFLRHEDEFEAISRPQLELTDEEVRSEFQDLCERAQPALESES